MKVCFFPAFFSFLGVLSTPLLAQTSVELQINNTASPVDDYLCWNPMRAQIRSATPTDSPTNVLVTFESLGTGSVGFLLDAGAWPTANNYTPADEIKLTLPSNGAWVPFFISGTTASSLTTVSDGNDIRVVAKNATDGAELGNVTTMVRVRKNAESLTEAERDIFLEAIANFHGHRRTVGPGNKYVKYAAAHQAAFRAGIHNAGAGNPLFLAWHRAFLLSLERELQAIDPRVALPYWRFDASSLKLFDESFIGAIPSGDAAAAFEVRFSDSNPLNGWFTRSEGPLTRRRNGNDDLTTILRGFSPLIHPLSEIFSQEGADLYRAATPENGFNSRSERNFHNMAHDHVGGFLGRGASPQDPLFFLLHANVDRAWAEWQARFDRFDRADIQAYPDQGRFPGGGMGLFREGSYADDVMWPWSQRDGLETPEELDDWPDTGFAFPVAYEHHGPVDGPTPGLMIDYMGQRGVVLPLGMCYDDLGYGEGRNP